MDDNVFYSATIVHRDQLKPFNTEDERDDFLKAVYNEINSKLRSELFSRVEDGEKIINLSPIKEEEYDFYALRYKRYCKISDLVRCKDCIHNTLPSSHGNACCELFYGMNNQFGFCSYGERRDNGEDKEDN